MAITQHPSRYNNKDIVIKNGFKLLIIIKIVILIYEQTYKDAPKRPLSIPPFRGLVGQGLGAE